MCLNSQHRVAILLHEGIRGIRGKTGLAYLRYGESNIVCVIDSTHAGQSLPQLTGIPKDIPIVKDVKEAIACNPDVLLIGIAPSGGALPEEWQQELKDAISAGLSLVNGLHTPISPQFPQLPEGQWIWDIRQEPQGLRVAKARAKGMKVKRILTVGTDMSVGKMSASLEIDQAARQKGIKSKFLATGQAGIMISGGGIALDAIRVDFAAGAVEQMILDWGNDYEWLIIEGQGSLLHPGSTATLPLMRGSQATDLILVHRAGQEHIHDLPQIRIPPLSQVVELYNTVASAYGTFGEVKVRGIALNTFHLDLESAKRAILETQEETGLPCTDVVRFGAETLLDTLLDCRLG